MTLVLLLRVYRVCFNRQKPEVIQLPLRRSPCGRHRIGVRRAAAPSPYAHGAPDRRRARCPPARRAGPGRSGRQRTHRGLLLIPGATPPQLMALHRPSCRLMDLDAELIVDFLTHIETEWRNGARPKLRANTRASINRDGRASTRRESRRLRVLIVPTRSVWGSTGIIPASEIEQWPAPPKRP